MGISVSALFSLVRGDQIPTDESLGKICRGLRLDKAERDELLKLATFERARSVTRVFLREIYAQADEKKATAPAETRKGVAVFNRRANRLTLS